MSQRPIPRRNHGRYFGERIDVDQVLRQLLDTAIRNGWRTETFLDHPDRQLHVLHRPVSGARSRVYLSSGIHGDEPAGPLALLELLGADAWPDNAELWLCPCLNPTGFRAGTRENADGIDLNRDYRHSRAPETRAHLELLNRLPAFDLTICLHEDWEATGFYLYELNPDRRPSLAPATIEAVSRVCQIDPASQIDGRPAVGGIINPDLDPATRPEWPEAFHLIQHKCRLSYTLEAPSDFDLPVRIRVLETAVRTLLR